MFFLYSSWRILTNSNCIQICMKKWNYYQCKNLHLLGSYYERSSPIEHKILIQVLGSNKHYCLDQRFYFGLAYTFHKWFYRVWKPKLNSLNSRPHWLLKTSVFFANIKLKMSSSSFNGHWSFRLTAVYGPNIGNALLQAEYNMSCAAAKFTPMRNM